MKVDRLAHQAAIDFAEKVQPASIQFRTIDESNLQPHWFGYSQLDVIMVAAPVLHRIENQQPDRFEQLQKWLAAGGNLWVYACDNSEKSFLQELKIDAIPKNRVTRASSVSSALDLKGTNDRSELVYDQWGGVQRASQKFSYRADTAQLGREEVFRRLKKESHPFASTKSVDQIVAQIAMGSFGLGTVIAIDAEDPFPGSYQFWKSIHDACDQGELVWTQRMGIDVPRGNDNYWMWLIESVGQPPVKSFVLLNTLFVILIGPVCYYYFRRRGRLYLLYLVAPLMALAVTLCLFAYALAADGTKTKLRSRQLTWIDSANRYHVSQSRQTYYAVLGSGGGITLDGDTAVYPVRNSPAFNRYYRTRGRNPRQGKYTVDDRVQRLAGAFLPARSQVQYLMTKPIQVDASLDFTFAPGTKESPIVRRSPCEVWSSAMRIESSGKPVTWRPGKPVHCSGRTQNF